MRDFVDAIAGEHLNSVRIKDEYVSAACPFHKGGQERSPSFWISRSQGNWGCFSCHVRGKDLEELLSQLGLGSRVGLKKEIERSKKHAEAEARKHIIIAKRKEFWDYKGTHTLPEALLGVYDWLPLELVEEGFSEEILTEHEIGYDRQRERITFPIRDVYGNLVGISGRQPDGMVPKYKVYTGYLTVDGKRKPNELGDDFPAYKADDVKNHLWGGHLVFDDLYNNRHDQLVVVEGYKAAMWVRQLGWKYTIAAMGSSLTQTQQRIIRAMGVDTFILLDNNDAGRRGSDKICRSLADSSLRVWECEYWDEMPDWCQPDDLDEDELEDILKNAKRRGGRSYGTLARFKARR